MNGGFSMSMMKLYLLMKSIKVTSKNIGGTGIEPVPHAGLQYATNNINPQSCVTLRKILLRKK